jgi:siroheme synthase
MSGQTFTIVITKAREIKARLLETKTKQKKKKQKKQKAKAPKIGIIGLIIGICHGTSRQAI